ncbi:MAG TPA: insulinase family protein [Planctomycetaceae bacterium]|nr:insulinase family protein [Planctomycetaceae bacterium]
MRAFHIAMGYVQFDDPHHYQRYITEYRKVTPADIRRVARKYLTPKKLVLEVVPPPPGESETPAVLVTPTAARDRSVKPRPVRDETPYLHMPAPAPTSPQLELPEVHRHTLSNGLDVWYAPWKTLPLVSVQLVIPAGGVLDGPERSGLARLTARCWDKGTERLTATQFAESLEMLGTSFSVNSGMQTTQVGFTVGADRLADSLGLLGDMLASPRFDDQDVARERRLMLSALARVRDNPQAIAARVFPRLLYGPDHPFGRPAAGFTQTVSELKTDDVRTFYQKYLRPRGAALVVVGDVDPQQLWPVLERQLGAWKGRVPQDSVPPVKAKPQAQRVYLVDKPGAVQSVLMVGRRWKGRRDPDFPAARVGNRVVGGDFTSRINKNLRERNGYTYGARSGFQFLKTEGRWVLQTAVRGNVTGAALREVVGELRAFTSDRPLTEAEFVTAKKAELSSLDRAFETPSSIAGLMLQMAIFELPEDYFQRRRGELEAVDLEAARRVVSDLVPPDRQTILIVGDRKGVERQLEQAGFRDVRVLDLEGNAIDQ